MATGRVVQVIGTVVDVEFPPEAMPAIYNALESRIGQQRLVLEVEQHVGNNWVRCLAMGPTEGLARGIEVVDTGKPIAVPVGEPALGRLLNASERPSTAWRRSTPPRGGPSTAVLRASRSNRPPFRSWRRA